MRFHKLEATMLAHPEWVPGMVKVLKESVKFYCGDIGDLPDMGKGIDVAQFPRLPFPAIALELILDPNSDIAIIMCQEFTWPNGDESVVCVPFIYYPESDEWSSSLAAEMNRATNQLTFRYPPGSTVKFDSEDRLEQCRIFVGACTYRAAKFLNVLNCANVKTENVEQPASLNKARLRKGKLPLYSYKVLVLKPSAARGSGGGGAHESPRIHLRRGHIKHRKTGDFWWQPCVVGDRRRGVVMKDYRADELVG